MHLATRDPLTGLPNRAALMDRLRQGVKAAAREKHQMAFMFLDLDRFKQVNDRFGHAAGDALLQRAGERMVSVLRDSDTVARLGGDEFAVVLPKLEDVDAARQVAEKLIAAIGAPMPIEDGVLQVECSVGLTVFPDDGDSDELLIRHADLAMYQAKSEGGNRCVVYTPGLHAVATERVSLEWELRQALERGEFMLFYQPQVSLAEAGRLTAVEALLRWKHPRLGVIGPSRIIPLAEESGLIWELGRFVIVEAVRQIAEWRDQGLEVPRVAVNVSPAQLKPGLLDIVWRALEGYRQESPTLEIEITESAIVSEGAQVLELLDALRRMGVSIAVDDFGVGYSSLLLLKRLPLHTLKIDRSFVEDLIHGKQDATIVRSMLGMAHAMGLRVVAEGVENEVQHAALRDMGCDEAQGYLFAQPLSAAEMTDWLKGRA